MSECKRNHISLPNSFSFCPYCGSKIERAQALSDTEVNEALLKLAQTWDKKDYNRFFIEVLKLEIRVKDALVRANVTPEKAVTMNRSDFQKVRMVGEVAIEQIIRNRLAYTG